MPRPPLSQSLSLLSSECRRALLKLCNGTRLEALSVADSQITRNNKKSNGVCSKKRKKTAFWNPKHESQLLTWPGDLLVYLRKCRMRAYAVLMLSPGDDDLVWCSTTSKSGEVKESPVMLPPEVGCASSVGRLRRPARSLRPWIVVAKEMRRP